MNGKLNNGSATKLRVGFFLAARQVRRTSLWTNILVVCIMVLTFLNLVVVTGILVGLIEGSVQAVFSHYLGDVFISSLREKTYVERSSDMIGVIRNYPGVKAVSGRYLMSGTLEADYKKPLAHPTDKRNLVPASLAGVDPVAEDSVSQLSKLVIEGQYLAPGDYDQVVLGAMLLSQYLDFDSPSFPVLKGVHVGDKVRVTVNGSQREVTVKGIIKSKVDEIDRRVFFTDTQLRGLIGRNDYNVGEISVRMEKDGNPYALKSSLLAAGFGDGALIQASEEAEPKFIQDMKKTFNMLGTAISSIGLVVAAITIFIVIFINALTRRKFIGILKGIGIDSLAIEYAYVMQAIFYAVLGTAIGCFIVFGFLKPYMDIHPINFPFSDGILVVPLGETAVRIVILLITTLVAGYIPVKIITRQNTLDAILNR